MRVRNSIAGLHASSSRVVGQCYECLQCLHRQQVRAASSASASGTYDRRDNSSEYYRSRPAGAVPLRRPPSSRQQNQPRSPPPLPSSLRKDWGTRSGNAGTTAPGSSGSSSRSTSNQFAGSSTSSRQTPGTSTASGSSSSSPSRPLKPLQLGQGSALAAFLSKGKSAAPAPSNTAQQQQQQQAPAIPLRYPVQNGAPSTGRSTAQSLAARRRRPVRKLNKKVEIHPVTSVAALAKLLDMKMRRLQLLMERMGMVDTRPDRLLNSEDASLVAMELGYDAVVKDENAFDIVPAPPARDTSSLPLRPPIVTVMGHVDHGKTSLLDALRSTSVAKGEAGGITQHIGAFSVPLSSLLIQTDGNLSNDDASNSITFLDTPGHAAFSAMRSRGASVTDVIVLVVAADDGVKPQTEEVAKLIKGEDVGIVVAITKCDKPGINIARVHNELLGLGIEVEQIGGDVPCVEVSAHTRAGLPELVETINAIAEVRELRAEVIGVPCEARVIESRKEVGRGNVATVIVTRGTLVTGDVIVAGSKSLARVRQLFSSDGSILKEATPGTPVEVTGWKDLPEAGDVVLQALDEESAKKALETRKRKAEQLKTMGDLDAINEKRRIEAEANSLAKDMMQEARAAGATGSEASSAVASAIRQQKLEQGEGTGIKELRLVVKADVSGTAEAVSDALAGIGNNEARVKIVHTGVGDVSDGDLALAKAVEGLVVGFNIKASRPMQSTANSLGVSIVTDGVIYRLIEQVRERVIDLLPKLYDSRVLGEATVQQIFKYNQKGIGMKSIAGCRVTNGIIQRKAKIRVVRDREVIFEGAVASLKHVKADIDEARKGSECGLSIEGFEDILEGDSVQAYEEVLRQRNL